MQKRVTKRLPFLNAFESINSFCTRHFQISADNDRTDNVTDGDDQRYHAVGKDQRIAGIIDTAGKDHRKDRQNKQHDCGNKTDFDAFSGRIFPDKIADHADSKLNRYDDQDDRGIDDISRQADLLADIGVGQQEGRDHQESLKDQYKACRQHQAASDTKRASCFDILVLFTREVLNSKANQNERGDRDIEEHSQDDKVIIIGNKFPDNRRVHRAEHLKHQLRIKEALSCRSVKANHICSDRLTADI